MIIYVLKVNDFPILTDRCYACLIAYFQLTLDSLIYEYNCNVDSESFWFVFLISLSRVNYNYILWFIKYLTAVRKYFLERVRLQVAFDIWEVYQVVLECNVYTKHDYSIKYWYCRGNLRLDCTLFAYEWLGG